MEEEEEETYYDAMKKDMGDRAARTKVCLTPSSLSFWLFRYFGLCLEQSVFVWHIPSAAGTWQGLVVGTRHCSIQPLSTFRLASPMTRSVLLRMSVVLTS